MPPHARSAASVALRSGAAITAVVVAVIAATFAGGRPASATSVSNATRYGGADRYATAALAAVSAFPAGAATAVVATGADYPDALAASYLAGLADGPTSDTWGGPILLTDPQQASPSMMQALSSLKVRQVFIAGGTSAVSANVQSQIAATPSTSSSGGNITVTRLAGTDRYDTARAIDEQPGASKVGGVNSVRTAVVASGAGFADALAAAPVAFSLTIPVVLTDPTLLVAPARQTLSDLGIKQVIITGGTASVSAAVEAQINAMGITTLFRAAGANRYDTAARLATYGVSKLGLTNAKAAIATGLNFPDALAAGPLAGINIEPILLVDPVPPETDAFVRGEASSLAHFDVMGSPAVIADTDVASLEHAVGNPNAVIGSTIHLGASDSGTQVSARVGDTAEVDLADVFDGGYQWKISQAPDPNVLALQSSQSVVRWGPAQTVGQGGMEVFNFQATGVGSTTLVLSYYGPGQQTATSTVQLAFQVGQSGAPPDCTSADLRASAVPGATSYSPGTPIPITVSLRNTSNHTCRQEQPYPSFTSVASVNNASGQAMWTDPVCVAGTSAAPSPLDLAPGQSYVVATPQWDQGRETQCPDSGGPQVPNGQYTSIATLTTGGQPVASDSATFTIG